MNYNKHDKQAEADRYDLRAIQVLSQEKITFSSPGLSYLPLYLRTPYIFFDELLIKKIKLGDRVLEIGAGTGRHTEVLVKSGANVTATDISENSLKVLQARMMHQLHIDVPVKVADMEKLPFEDRSFDFVVSAGSLSYGDNNIVLNEIYRVLKQGGSFICVDSLNHNPIYRFNRWVQYLKGKRSISTINRMPTISLLNKYESKFEETQVNFFGSLIWLSPILVFFLKKEMVGKFFDRFDTLINVKRSAFKFVAVFYKK